MDYTARRSAVVPAKARNQSGQWLKDSGSSLRYGRNDDFEKRAGLFRSVLDHAVLLRRKPGHQSNAAAWASRLGIRSWHYTGSAAAESAFTHAARAIGSSIFDVGETSEEPLVIP
jgi:hypothetical protein